MTKFESGQTVSVTTRDHGHLAASRVKSFSGTVVAAGEGETAQGTKYEWISVKLAPAYRATRHFTTYSDSIEIVR